MMPASAAPAHNHHEHDHAAHGHSHAHHDHAHHHGPVAAPVSAGFSLIALSASARLALALPPIGALWLLTAWALGNG